MQTHETGKRYAQLAIDTRGGHKTITVSLPPDSKGHDFGRVNEHVIDAIKGLTGCPCYSGAVNVIFQHQFDKIIQIELGAHV